MPIFADYLSDLSQYQLNQNKILLENRRPFDSDTVKKVYQGNDKKISDFEIERNKDFKKLEKELSKIKIKYPLNQDTLLKLSTVCREAGANIRSALEEHFNKTIGRRNLSSQRREEIDKYITEATRNYVFKFIGDLAIDNKIDEMGKFVINDHILNIFHKDDKNLKQAFDDEAARKIDRAVSVGDKNNLTFTEELMSKYHQMIGARAAQEYLLKGLPAKIDRHNNNAKSDSVRFKGDGIDQIEKYYRDLELSSHSKLSRFFKSKSKAAESKTIEASPQTRERSGRDRSPPRPLASTLRPETSTKESVQYYQSTITAELEASSKQQERKRQRNNAPSDISTMPQSRDPKALKAFSGVPAEQIKKQNENYLIYKKKKNEIPKPEKPSDFMAFDPVTGTGVCATTGMRETQEDRENFGVVSGFELLSPGGKEAALKNFVSSLNKMAAEGELKQEGMVQGTTLCHSVVVRDEIYNVSVGDSRAYKLVWDEQGNVVECKRINKQLDNVKNMSADEVNTLKSKKVNIQDNGRLGGVLGITRAIGQGSAEAFYPEAIRQEFHEPHYSTDKVDIPKNGRAVLMTGCDGIEEAWDSKGLSDAEKEKFYQEFFKGKHKMSTMELAEATNRFAIALGSDDNVSSMFMDIDPNNPAPRYNSVQDGNGGDAISHAIYLEFDAELAKQVVVQIQEGKTQENQDQLESKKESKEEEEERKAPLYTRTPP